MIGGHRLDRKGFRIRAGDTDPLEKLARWLDKEPEVPEGPWYKRFTGMIACGDGEWIKTFLLPGQLVRGKRVD